jgi:probable HAF family extracellular repeat protein
MQLSIHNISRWLCAGMAVCLAATIANAQYYSVTDLGTISGPLSNAKGLDSAGRVAGVSIVASNNFHAAIWDGVPIDMGTIGVDTQSIAYAINDAGAVVGVSYNYGDLQPNAFMWQAGTLTPLGQFSPRDVNAAGVIVGHRTMFNAQSLWVEQACRWMGGSLVDLNSLGGYSSQAFAINTAGEIAGESQLSDNMTVRACLWLNGTPHDLGSLAGTATAKSAALDLNSAGQVVGWSDTAAGPLHACLFEVDAGGQVTGRIDLGALSGSSSVAMGINEVGVVVGASDYRGFVWDSGVMTDLNDLIPPGEGWKITRAVAINESGVIAADGDLLGFTHAVLLTPNLCVKGDVNADGSINALDIHAMVGTILEGGTPWELCAGDLGAPHDGAVTGDDIGAFVQCLLGGPCN